MRMGFCEGLHSQFDTVLKWKFFQADRLEDFTGSVDEVCFFFCLDKSLMGTQG